LYRLDRDVGAGRYDPAVVPRARLDRLLAALRGGDAQGSDRRRQRGHRRAAGAYFTPPALVELVVEEALAARLDRDPPGWRDDGSPELVVLDPAAGDGRFLAAAADALAARAAGRGFDPAAARAAVVRRCLIGLERDSRFAAEASQRLPGARIVRCEALLEAPAELPAADLVLGNPPYQRSIHLRGSDPALWRALRGRLAATSYKEWDLYAAFVERALDWAAPGGEVALVTPSRWLTAAFAGRLRQRLAGQAALRQLIDFGAEQIFADATTYAAVVFLSRSRSATVAVSRLAGAGRQTGAVAAPPPGQAPWRLAVGPARALDQLAAVRRLGEVAHIAKGAGSNADPVYVVEPRGGRWWSAALDREVELEAELVRPCLRGRDVPEPGRPARPVGCLVPYDRGGRLLEPDQLSGRHPRAWDYLVACRDRLEAREHGRFRGDRFYQFGRPQNLAFLGDRAAKLVVPVVARAARAFLDRGGRFVLDTAYALRLRAEVGGCSLELLAELLCSPLATLWLRHAGVPLRGGYLRMKTAYLADLPVPADAAELARWNSRIGSVGDALAA